MPSPNDIPAFLLSNVYASSEFPATNATPMNAAKVAGATVDYKIITYDFVNGTQTGGAPGPNALDDSDRHSPAGTQFPDTVGSSGDRIYLDGDTTEYYVHSLFRFDITVNYSDGSSVTYNEGARAFVLHGINNSGPNHGSVIVSPLDTVRADMFNSGGVKVASMTLGPVEAETSSQRGTLVQATDLAAQDDIICFAHGTVIQTRNGPVAIEKLCVDDLIKTKGNGLQPIRWIGSRKFSAKELDASPNLRPIRICAGALGANIPEADLMVSPQHRILVRSKIAQRMFGAAQVLVSAKQLLELDGVGVAEDLAEVEYFHLMFNQHEIILSNGAETESMYAGKQAQHAVGETARKEIFAIFPELKDGLDDVIPAAILAPGRQARQLARRHKKNMLPLMSA